MKKIIIVRKHLENKYPDAFLLLEKGMIKVTLYEIFYIDHDGKESSVRFICVDKSEARRFFYCVFKNGEKIKRIDEIRRVCE